MGKENRSLYPGLRYIEVLYIMRFHCHLSEKAMNDQTKKIYIPHSFFSEIPPRETSPRGEERGKMCVFSGDLIQ